MFPDGVTAPLYLGNLLTSLINGTFASVPLPRLLPPNNAPLWVNAPAAQTKGTLEVNIPIPPRTTVERSLFTSQLNPIRGENINAGLGIRLVCTLYCFAKIELLKSVFSIGLSK
ncbi:hypothetical protein D3C81_927860 [compost metagenome]